MSDFYTPQRPKGLYVPGSDTPFKLSRSKIDLFVECPRCFYLDRRLGVGRPPGFPFNLNSAVDTLLKKEFDVLRREGKKHALIEQYGVDAIPVSHPYLDQWRTNFTGIQYLHEETNFFVFGAIDDLWQSSSGEYIVVDYKATSKDARIIALDKDWHGGYKRQMEVYQWLLRHNNLKVSDTGYFVYCNGNAGAPAFDGKLEFDVTLIAYTGNDSWVDGKLREAKQCLEANVLPTVGEKCDYCAYREAAGKVLQAVAKGQQRLI